MHQIARSTKDINHCLKAANACIEQGSKVPGMSYEEGVADAIRWIVGDTDANPMDDDVFAGVLGNEEDN